jgi:hypothetical protein
LVNSSLTLSRKAMGICRPTDSTATTQYAVENQTIYIISMLGRSASG